MRRVPLTFDADVVMVRALPEGGYVLSARDPHETHVGIVQPDIAAFSDIDGVVNWLNTAAALTEDGKFAIRA